MRILIIGAAGMLGRKLSERLTRDRALGTQAITALTLADLAGGVGIIAADVTQPGVAADLVDARPDVIIDLAAVVSGEAETDFEKGYRVNLDATRYLLEAIRPPVWLHAAPGVQLLDRGVRAAHARRHRR